LFADTGDIELRPLTVLLGSNNVGKTSLIAPLLIARQTMLSRDRRAPLVTRGDWINVGDFDDYVFRHDKTRAVKLTFGFHVHDDLEPKEELGAAGPGSCQAEFTLAPNGSGVRLSRYRILDIYGRALLERRLGRTGNYSLKLSAPPSGSVVRGSPDAAARRAMRDDRPVHFSFSPTPVFSAAVEATRPAGPTLRARELDIDPYTTMYLDIVDNVYDELMRLAYRIQFVGPLRDEPQRVYQVHGETPIDVGSRGQLSAELLYRSDGGPLLRSVNQWLPRFGFPGGIRVRRLTAGAFSLDTSVDKNRPRINIADTGFGLSQLLPLLVQSFNAASESILLFEQPEIHLNPGLQVTLADLFCTVAKDRTVVVETHSEHFILRLRRLVAEGTFDAKDVALLYFDDTNRGARIRQVSLQSNGHIPADQWPKGFFEEGLQQSVGLAAAQRTRS
jgi:hypothetical protein